jgi:hypothetical protein
MPQSPDLRNLRGMEASVARLWRSITARHRAKVAEQRAIADAANEMARAGAYDSPALNPINRIRAWISGQGM